MKEKSSELSLPKKEHFAKNEYVVAIIVLVIVWSTLLILVGFDIRFDLNQTTTTPQSSNSADNIYDTWERMKSECDRFGSPGNFPSMDNQFAWNECRIKADSWLENNLP